MPGLREWFAALGQVSMPATAFDTRLEGLAVLTGRASGDIASHLRRPGFTLLAKPESFLVTKDNQLRAGEEFRAWDWSLRLSRALAESLAIARRPA